MNSHKLKVGGNGIKLSTIKKYKFTPKEKRRVADRNKQTEYK